MPKQKAFFDILKALSHAPHKAEHFLADRRLTQTEKRIIEGHLQIRNNHNQKVIEGITKIPPSEMAFVEAQRHLLLGVAYNNLSKYKEAMEHLLIARDRCISLTVPHSRFLAEFNLFILAYNTHDLPLMERSLQALKQLPLETPTHEQRLLRCLFLFHTEIEAFDEAREYLGLIQIRKQKMVESDLISHLVSEFMFHVILEDFSACEKNLAEMKKHRKFHLTENYQFMKALLLHIKDDAPLYLQESEVKSTPILFHQLSVIRSLESKNSESATHHWNALALLAPKTYLKDFHFSGRKCLFSISLEKHRLPPEVRDPGEALRRETQAATLIELLKTSPGSISKESLFRIIWGHPPHDKKDLQRLARLVSKVRAETGLLIETRKGTYRLKSDPLKKKAS